MTREELIEAIVQEIVAQNPNTAWVERQRQKERVDKTVKTGKAIIDVAKKFRSKTPAGKAAEVATKAGAHLAQNFPTRKN